MSSPPVSETLISASSPIADLIHHAKYEFRERVFNEIQNILTDRENRLKLEIETLVRERDSAKEEARNSRRKCQEVEETIAKILRENSASRDREKMAEELDGKNKLIVELNAKITELKTRNSELGLKQSQSEHSERRLEDLGSRIVKIEESLSGMLNLDVRDPANASLVSEMCKLGASVSGNLDISDFWGKNDHSRIRLPENSCGSRIIEVSNEKGACASSGSDTVLGEEYSKIVHSSPASEDMIDTADSDDSAANPVGEKEIDSVRLGQSPSSTGSGKRDRAGSSQDILANGTAKRKRNTCTSREDNSNTNAVSLNAKNNPPQKIASSSSDEGSTDSDESCSDSKIINLIASIKSKKR